MATMYFNPRLREGGDRAGIAALLKITDFNPRLQEGGDCNPFGVLNLNGISIHASKKEATIFI